MKKYFAIAFAAVAAMACQKEIGNYESKLGPFTASIESYDETKTFTDASLEVKWSEGDFINLWNAKTASDKYTITASSVGRNTAELELVQAGQAGAETLSANIGYYPYAEGVTCVADAAGYKLSGISLPAMQTYAADSFGNGALPMVALTSSGDDKNLAFRNVCGVLRVVLSGDMLVKTVSVTGNNNEVLCGDAEVSASNADMPTISMTGDGKTVTLDCGEGVQINSKTSFDIALPPVTFEKGFTVKVNDKAYLTTTRPHAIKRSHILCMTSKTVVSNDYLKFTSEGETTIALDKVGTPDDITLLYFKDSEGEWKPYTIGESIALSNGESVLFKAGDGGNATFSKKTSFSADLSTVSSGGLYEFKFGGDGKVSASGNVMSLLDANCESTTCPEYCFYRLFWNCTNLVSAPELPATTLATACYMEMFYGCTGLTGGPELPASTLAEGCYWHMFDGCIALVQAPALPATTLALRCYREMFYGCSSLTNAPSLPATTMAEYCYQYMFGGCTALTTAPDLPAMSLAQGCYMGMFSGCTGLTTAPELPATTLANSCYNGLFRRCAGLKAAPKLIAATMAYGCYSSMFSECTGLESAPELISTTMAQNCYSNMFYGCTGLKSAPALPATTMEDGCYMSMFMNCTGLTSAPELPATTLAKSCYHQLFAGCTGLTSGPELPAVKLGRYCYTNMFKDCTNLTTAPELPATELTDGCYQAMFKNCTALTTAPELPAGILKQLCYLYMFQGCSNLNYIKMLALDVSANDCMIGWTDGVSSTGTFVRSAAASWYVTGADGIPWGWTVQTNRSDESANCYIISEPGTYKIATVKGHTTASVGAVASADVLWESFGTDTAPAEGDLVKNISYSDGYISFIASDKEGNAVIAARDADGKILWSWHIWLTDKPSDQTYNNNAGVMMDRNLGATSAAKGSVDALGLLYQWGRKDPFLGSSSISGCTKAASTITWPSAVESDASIGTIEYAVENPTTFIAYNKDCGSDWFYKKSSIEKTRWITAKGLYDPCPAGYKVPGGNPCVWYKAFGADQAWTTASNWDATNKGMDFGATDKTLGSGTIWYPAAGYISPDDGTLCDVGNEGSYWSCYVNTYFASIGTFYFGKSGEIYNASRGGAAALPVRCIKE